MAAPLDPQHLAIAGVYSEAMLSLASASGQEDALLEELEGLVAVLGRQPEFEAFLESPLADPQAQRQLLEKVLRGQSSDVLVDALQVLRRKGRLGLVRAVAATYRGKWLRRKNRVEVGVTTAVPLTPALRESLIAAANRATGKTAQLLESVDPALLGGMVVRIGDRKLDRSVAADVARLGEALMARASRELQSGKSTVIEDASA
jgi:F-type H+-transporting ATPase subunit delta